MGSKAVETLIGAVVIAVAVAFFVFAYSKADIGGTSGYHVFASFNAVGGLKPGADVRVSGIKVGQVVAMRLDQENYYVAKVMMTIEPGISLPLDTSASIASEGLLGGNYVALQPGAETEMLKPGDEVAYVQDAVDLMDVISRQMFGGVSSDQGGSSDEGGLSQEP